MRLRRQHGAHDTTDYLKLADSRTAMKNTDAVFVRRGMGAKNAGWAAEVLVRFENRFHRNLAQGEVEHIDSEKLIKKIGKPTKTSKKLWNCSREVRGLVPFFPWASYVALPSGRRTQRQPPALFESIGNQNGQ